MATNSLQTRESFRLAELLVPQPQETDGNGRPHLAESTPFRVLMIEDNPGDVRLIQELLKEAGLANAELQHVAKLDEGLRELAEGQFDVILLDLGLADSQGPDTFDQVQTQAPRAPIIVLTGLADQEVATKMVGAGAQDYLVKGQVDGPLLGRAIRYAIERKHVDLALRESEALYRTLSENSPVGIWQLTPDGRTLYANPAMCAMLQVEDADELADQSYHQFLTPEGLATARAEHAQRAQGVTSSYEITLVGKRGRKLDVVVHGAPIFAADGEFHSLIGTVVDVTERKRATQKTKQQLSRMRALHDIDKTIAASTDLHFSLDLILNKITTQLGVDAATVLLLNPRTRMLEFAAGQGFRFDAITHSRVRLGEEVAGRAALERRMIEIPNLPEDDAYSDLEPVLAGEDMSAYYALPLLAKGEVKGVLEVFHRTPLDPDAQWLKFLETLGGQTALAIDNARLFEDLQRSNVELKLAYDATLEGWARALDLRGVETMDHCRRVTETTVQLAQALGIHGEDLVHIRRGALLHDVGMLSVPDRILKKSDTLDEEEWELVQQHPVYAYELLSTIEFLRPALDIPYYHHERWDGSGYPFGLKEAQIPLAARIFAVADLWDTLRSDSAYRDSRSDDRTLAHIREQAGKHLDPQVVEAFLDMEA